jgi:PAS domain S-box-containing protein
LVVSGGDDLPLAAYGPAGDDAWRQRLRDPEQRFRALIERIPAVVYIDRPDGTGVYVSPQVRAITGVSEEAWLAGIDGWLAAVHPDDRGRVLKSFLSEAGESGVDEYRVVLPDGRVRWLYDEAVGLFDEDHRLELWHGVIVDVTERVRAEQALRRSEARRRAVMGAMISNEEQTRQRIAGELHDDTIQIMTASLLAVDQLLAALTRGEVVAAKRAASRARDSLADAIDRTRRLTFELRPQALDVHGLAAAVRMLARRAADQAGFRVSVRANTERYPDPVETLIYRTVAEAVTNARRHSGATHLSIRLRDRSGAVECSVKDDGCGFDAGDSEWQERLGLHFGLQAAAERVQLAGGEFRVDSKPGGGTCVRFRIPVET